MERKRRHAQLVNIDEVEGRPLAAGTKIGATIKTLGFATGARGTGCTHYEVPPGKAAFPHHFHCLIEESIFILEGEGTLRIAGDTLAVRAGDYVSFPVGPQSAHQLRNSGGGVLRYLCFSSNSSADIVGYPDSKKIGAMAAATAADVVQGSPWVRVLTYEDSKVGYYDGEDLGDH
jgi:uncharacterized cupin superfamily protein